MRDAAGGCWSARRKRAGRVQAVCGLRSGASRGSRGGWCRPSARRTRSRSAPGRGVRMISTPSLLKTSSKARLNLLSWSWIRNRIGVGRSVSDQASWRACWVVQRPSRVGAAAGEVDASAGEFEEEEHVEASEPERLDGEEVAGDDRVGVGVQELAPAELGASARRRHAALPKDLGDRRRRDSLTDTCELTDDPLVAPAWVLARESQHELTDLCRDCGPARSRSGTRPPSPYKLAVPTQQCVRLNEERRPARPAEKPAGRGKKHPVRLVQPRHVAT